MTENELARRFPTFEKELLSEILNAAEIKTVHADEIIVRSGQNIRAAI
jgi:CRP/FNR family transcriptional regulator, anaerobic regulatory protein